jgi:hypothetical protein
MVIPVFFWFPAKSSRSFCPSSSRLGQPYVVLDTSDLEKCVPESDMDQLA